MSVSNIMRTLDDGNQVITAERLPQIHIFSSATVEVSNTNNDNTMFQLQDSSSDPNIELDIGVLHPNTTYTAFLQFTVAVTGDGQTLDVVRIQPQYTLDQGSTFIPIENGTREIARAYEATETAGSSDNVSIPFSFTTTNTPSDNIVFRIQAQLALTPDAGVNVEINSTPYGGAGITERPPFQLLCFH